MVRNDTKNTIKTVDDTLLKSLIRTHEKVQNRRRPDWRTWISNINNRGEAG